MKRNHELLEEAQAAGIPREQAEFIIQIALDEELDPELAIEVVRRGLHQELMVGDAGDTADAPATDRYLPEWMFPQESAEQARWERAFRISFRKLRSRLEEHPDIDQAFDALTREA